MININFKITENEVTKINQVGDSTTGSIGQIKCTFDLDPIYSDMTCIAVFNDIKIPMIRGVCYADNIPEGRCVVGLYAYSETDGTVDKRISPKPCVIVVDRGSYLEGHDPEPPTASETERFYNLINEAISSGQIKGEKGDKGDPGKDYVLTDDDLQKISALVEVPTKTSELQNDSNFVSDENYVHTDNNFTNEEKTKLENDVATKDYVEQEIATFDFIKIVEALPEQGLPNRTYFVPKTDQQTNDLYDEYMWVNNKWEFVGTRQIEVDLTNYVKNTDYASTAKGGIVQLSMGGGFIMDSNKLRLDPATTIACKLGIYSYVPITPAHQHEATFYGLAKASGDTTQSKSSNAVGKYTDEAKLKIQNMLGVQPKFEVGNGLKFADGTLQLDIPVATAELIHEGTTTSSVPYIEISENQKGQAFAYTHLYYEIENANGFGLAAQGAGVNLRTNLNNNTAENITNTLGNSISELDKVKWIRESVSVMALGKIKKEFCWQIGSGFSRSVLSGVGFSNIWGTMKKISKIKIYFSGALSEIPNGTKIKIWGWN